ncbi:glycoside hydrolase family 16 protein [Pseudonocardia asaccharolytica]|nr:glycoside hydrolase family 16 protein [Pseudonocardia asaccharolytica]
MRRKPSAADDRLDPRELIARITAEHGSPVPSGRHHRRGSTADVEVETAPPARRSALRKLTPLAVGAAAMVLATTIMTAVQPAGQASPELNAALASNGAVSSAPGSSTAASTAPETSPPASSALAPGTAAATEARERATSRATPRPTAATTNGGAAASAGGGERAATAGAGTQAAVVKGWKLVGGDEFNGGLSGRWVKYDGAGHAGNGRRSAGAISVENGSLVIRGDSNGTTGGMAWAEGQRYGKWEMRAKFPAGDRQYHPVLILWPTDMGWPEGGEVDFAETTSASNDVSFFLHYGSSNQQKYAKKALDITQWHNYAVEWTPQGITGYIDGVPWFSSSDPSTLPPGKMHPTIQLDYFPNGGSPKPSEMYVDWMRIYA